MLLSRMDSAFKTILLLQLNNQFTQNWEANMEPRKLENLVLLKDGREQPCHDISLCTQAARSQDFVSGWLNWSPGQSTLNVGSASHC